MSEPTKQPEKKIEEPLRVERVDFKDGVIMQVPGHALSNVSRVDNLKRPFATLRLTRLGVAIDCKDKHAVVPYASCKIIYLNKPFEE